MGNRSEVLELVLKAKDLASKEVGKVGKSLDLLNGTAGVLVAGGIGALVGGLGLAAKAAIDEQKNIAKLDAALKANVPGWTGNTDAIERTIAAREDLAFSDDELRSSLATLVTSTKDVSKATDLQTLAMDLARAKGVSLETATTAIAKASQGSTKEIKALGLEVSDTASATEILGAIQKATAGQAAAYAGTMSGKWETFQNKLGDVVETVGGALLPIIETAMDFLLTTAIPAFAALADKIGPVVGFVVDLAGAIVGPLVSAFGAILGPIGTALDWIGGLIGKVREFLGLADKADKRSRNLPDLTDFRGETRRYNTLTDRGHAAGGLVRPGEWSWVGERGPELVRFGASGRVFSAGASAGMAGGSAAPVTIPVLIDGRQVARIVDEHLFYRLDRAAPTSGRV